MLVPERTWSPRVRVRVRIRVRIRVRVTRLRIRVSVTFTGLQVQLRLQLGLELQFSVIFTYGGDGMHSSTLRWQCRCTSKTDLIPYLPNKEIINIR